MGKGSRDSQRKAGAKRGFSSSLVTAQEKYLTQLAAFSPAIAHWELSELQHEETQTFEASSWELRVALLFVDISGFTNLCTRLDIDCLQRHINTYFTQLIDIVVARGGDVLRFAGDAIFCSFVARAARGRRGAHPCNGCGMRMLC
jgi:class 3 adenylate cyclase